AGRLGDAAAGEGEGQRRPRQGDPADSGERGGDAEARAGQERAPHPDAEAEVRGEARRRVEAPGARGREGRRQGPDQLPAAGGGGRMRLARAVTLLAVPAALLALAAGAAAQTLTLSNVANAGAGSLRAAVEAS